MGADHVRRIHEVTSGARVTAVVDVDAERAKAVAARVDGCTAYTDPAAAMAAADVDAVLIASPGPAHEATLLAVLEAELRLGHRRVQVGFMRRYDPEYARLKTLLATGQLGRPLMVHNRHRNAASPPFFTSTMLITDSVAHEVDATRWLLDHEITAVTVLRPTPSANAPDGLRDPQFVVFETDGGALSDVEIFVNCGFGYQVQAEVVCERGTARIGDGHALVTNMAGRWGGTIAQDFTERFETAYDHEIQAWVDATRRGEVTGPSVWDGYAAAAVCEAGVRALEDGGRVDVELAEKPALYA
jgi:myo-inositol 2-dehydrogenase/D-chiro-inositol 1-dehydrogenase